MRDEKIPPEVAAELAMHTAEDHLTERELEGLKLISKGNADKKIAAQLSVREDTVRSRVGNILEKLGANDRTHAVTIGLKGEIPEARSELYANLHVGGKELLYRASLSEVAERHSIPSVLSAIVRLSSTSKVSCTWSRSPMANLR